MPCAPEQCKQCEKSYSGWRDTEKVAEFFKGDIVVELAGRQKVVFNHCFFHYRPS